MNPNLPASLDPALLDDFFAEADDHLSHIRQGLLALETSAGSASHEIFAGLKHHLHSLKGISALAGLSSAENLAHATEDFLRGLTKNPGPLPPQALDTVMAATKGLEQLVAAFRSGTPFPNLDALLHQLQPQSQRSVVTPEAPASASGDSAAPAPADLHLKPGLQTHIQQAKARGLSLFECTFSPSQELAAHGLSINSVRSELSHFGEILSAAPRVLPGGNLSFEFLVAAPNPPQDPAAWKAKGIVFHTAEPDAPLPASIDAPKPASHTPFLTPSHIVRVDLQRLDELMRIAGEMVIHRSRLETQLALLDNISRAPALRAAHEVSNTLGRSLRELRETVMRVRLVPVAELFSRMPFVVRDLSREAHKNVRLKFSGQETAIDKYLAERLKDPLLHLVRNAFTHGIESAEERAAAGKPPEAVIELTASTVGDAVILQVRDDGHGIDNQAVLLRAEQLGLQLPGHLDNTSLLSLLCSPGFSTRTAADRAAGRGVGMAVVNDTLRELGGQLSLETTPGQGTLFTLRLPLTLAIADTLIVSAAGQTCAVPQSFITEILHAAESQVQCVNGVDVVPYRSGILPVVRLASLFNLPPASKPQLYLLVITSERGSVGLLTEQVLGQREVVVNALQDPLLRVPAVSGATELGDGKPVLILDGLALTSGSVRPIDTAHPKPALN